MSRHRSKADLEKLDITEFKITNISPGSGVFILGKTHSGKSVLMQHIMQHVAHHFSYGKAITPSVSSKKTFRKCMPEQFIETPSIDRFKEYIDRVKSRFEDDDAEGKPTRRTFFIADDVACDEKFMKCQRLVELFMNGRHFGMFRMLVLQYIKCVGPKLRGNADYVFVFWHGGDPDQKMIWENWFTTMPKETFKKIFEEVTVDYGALVIDIRKASTSRDWHDYVHFYKAPMDTPIFRMCDDDFYRLGRRTLAHEFRRRAALAAGRVRMINTDGEVVSRC